MTTPTALPVPSKDPRDLLFNAEKLDEILNSTGLTVMNRQGNQVLTVAGALAEFPNAAAHDAAAADSAAAAAASLAAMQDQLDDGITAGIAAGTAGATAAAAASAAAAAAEAVDAAAAAAVAESARDAAVIQPGLYATEAAGRAAVTDGQAFKVQGAGAVAAYEYRRTNSSTSVLIATYPSSAAVTTLQDSVAHITNIAAYNSYFTGGAGNGSATGLYNAGSGIDAVAALTTGANNAALGAFSAVSLTSGSSNVAAGFQALSAAITSSFSTAVGAQALLNCTVSGNTAVGESAALSVTTAANLLAVGRRAAYAKTTGDDCTFMGHQAGFSGQVGEVNTGIGVTAVGAYAFGHMTTGSYNAGCGRASGWYVNTGSNNSYLGYRSGYGNTIGSDNVAAGFYAGHNTSTGDKNTMLGARADYYVPNSSAMTATPSVGGAVTAGAHNWRVTFVLDGVETALSEPAADATTAGANLLVSLASIPVYVGPKTCSARKVYRTAADVENVVKLVATIADNTTTIYTDTTADGSLGAPPTHSSGSIMLGYEVRAYKAGQLVAGSAAAPISEVWIGGDIDDASPAAVTHSPSGGKGTNVAGGLHRIAGGRGTGTAKGGSVALAASPAGSSGSTQNALVDWVTLDGAGFLGIKESTSAAVPTPSAGSVNLFVEGGALKFRNSAGTVKVVTAV